MTVNWPTTQLGEVAQLQRGLSYVAMQLRPPGRPFITLKCFEKGGGFRSDGLKTFAGSATSEYELQGGELLIANTDLTRDASVVGAPALVPRFDGDLAVFSMDVSRLLTNASRVDNKFLALRLTIQDARSFMQARSGGSTVLHLQLRSVPKFQFQLPPLPEQRQIAAVLDTLDEAIQKTEQIIAKLKQVKQGLLHDLLTRGIDDNGELRDPERHPEQFKDSPLGRIPRGWEVVPLGNLIASAVDGPFGSNLKTEHYVSQPGVRVVRLQNIGIGRFLEGDGAYVSNQHAQTLYRHDVRSGDMLVASLGDERHPYGRACIYPSDLSPGIVKADCFRLRFDEFVMVPDFVAHALNSPFWNQQLRGLGQGVTRDRINLGNLLRISVPRPKLREQLFVFKTVRAHQWNVDREEGLAAKLRLLKAGLMEDLLTGRVRVTGLLEETPA